jgi:hypothetical protein
MKRFSNAIYYLFMGMLVSTTASHYFPKGPLSGWWWIVVILFAVVLGALDKMRHD